jgi:hypothetical protein
MFGENFDRRIKSFFLLSFFFSSFVFAQTDYSDSWEDLYSYTNAKAVVKNGNFIYAIVDNAVFLGQ